MPLFKMFYPYDRNFVALGDVKHDEVIERDDNPDANFFVEVDDEGNNVAPAPAVAPAAPAPATPAPVAPAASPTPAAPAVPVSKEN